jgi:hypothetical protein
MQDPNDPLDALVRCLHALDDACDALDDMAAFTANDPAYERGRRVIARDLSAIRDGLRAPLHQDIA